MTWEAVVALAFGGPTAVGAFVWMARKMFVAWTRDNVAVVGHDATAAVMTGLREELERLSKNNKELADENRALQKQINRLEAILARVASRFGVPVDDVLLEQP